MFPPWTLLVYIRAERSTIILSSFVIVQDIDKSVQQH